MDRVVRDAIGVKRGEGVISVVFAASFSAKGGVSREWGSAPQESD
jgi:hypothetical protein